VRKKSKEKKSGSRGGCIRLSGKKCRGGGGRSQEEGGGTRTYVRGETGEKMRDSEDKRKQKKVIPRMVISRRKGVMREVK